MNRQDEYRQILPATDGADINRGRMGVLGKSAMTFVVERFVGDVRGEDEEKEEGMWSRQYPMLFYSSLNPWRIYMEVVI